MITSKVIATGILKAVGVLAAIALGLYFLYLIQSVLIYLIISLILTLIGNPILDFFKRRLKFKHLYATIATLLIFLLIIVGFIMMFVPLIMEQGQNLSLLNTSQIEKDITKLVSQISHFLESHNIDSEKLFKENDITSKLNFGYVSNFLNVFLSALSSFGVGLASVLFITFFFLKDRELFIVNAKKLIKDTHEEQILNSFHKINNLLSRYFIGLLLQLFIVFVLYLILLLIFGIENAFIIAFICAVLNIIPYIGPLISAVLAAILTMISNLDSDFQTQTLPLTLYILIGFWVVQLIDNNLSQPYIFSKSVSSHPLEIFLIIIIVGFLFGIVGMIIAVPFYTILKVFAKEFFPENKVVQLFTKNI